MKIAYKIVDFYSGRRKSKRSSLKFIINPQAPVAQKVADELVFRRFHGEGVEFF